MSPLAKAFRENVKRVVVDNLHLLNIPTDKETVFEFELRAYFDSLENAGWFETWDEDKFYTKDILFPKKHKRAGELRFNKGDLKALKGQRKAETRYKRIDADNRVKFLQDCVVIAVGIPDDSQVFRAIQEKHEDPNNPRAEVKITVIARDQFFRR